MAFTRVDYLDLPMLDGGVAPAGARGRACACFATITVLPDDAIAGRESIGCPTCNSGLRVRYTALGKGIALFYAGNYAQALLRYAEARAAGELAADDFDFNVAEALGEMVARGRASGAEAAARYKQMCPAGKHGALLAQAAAVAATAAKRGSPDAEHGVTGATCPPAPPALDARAAGPSVATGAGFRASFTAAGGAASLDSLNTPSSASVRVASAADGGMDSDDDDEEGAAGRPQAAAFGVSGAAVAAGSSGSDSTRALDARGKRTRYLRKKLREVEALAARAELATVAAAVGRGACESPANCAADGLTAEEAAKVARWAALAAELAALDGAAAAATAVGAARVARQ
jgi:hypothetical protein